RKFHKYIASAFLLNVQSYLSDKQSQGAYHDDKQPN
ncbi:MAG: hypothetical protein ACI9B8_003899, partial [Sulfitobacter sp.]